MVRRMVRSFAKFEMAVHWVGVRRMSTSTKMVSFP